MILFLVVLLVFLFKVFNFRGFLSSTDTPEDKVIDFAYVNVSIMTSNLLQPSWKVKYDGIKSRLTRKYREKYHALIVFKLAILNFLQLYENRLQVNNFEKNP